MSDRSKQAIAVLATLSLHCAPIDVTSPQDQGAADSGGATTVVDSDGRVYPIVVIGTQRWLGRNLETTRYRDGAPIDHVPDPTDWRLVDRGAYVDYDNSAAGVPTYGRLYNGLAVATGKLCPTGWHVPTDAEWATLESFLGEPNMAGGRLKQAGTAHWQSPNTSASNDTGFAALPGGSRFSTGTFAEQTYKAYFWTATTGSDPSYGIYRYLDFNSGFLFRNEDSKHDGNSVRCLAD